MKNRINISLLLLSFALFVYQVCLLRIFSVADYYHFAFMIVSISLLGFGISGSFLYFFINRFKNQNLIFIIFGFGFSVSVLLSFFVTNLIPFDSFKIAWELRQLWFLAVYYLFLVLPFFFGGSFIGYAFYCQERPGVTYFYNNIGSAGGAIAALFIIQYLGKDGALYIATAIGLISAGIIVIRRYRRAAVIIASIFLIIVISLVIFIPGVMDINMSPYKSLPTVLRNPDSRVVYSSENSYAQLDIIDSPSIKSAPGLSLKYQKVPPSQKGITVDGDNLSAITEIEGDTCSLAFLDFIPASVPYALKPYPEKVLIVEPGGGMDILSALYYKSGDIKVLENNRLIVEAMSGEFSGFSGDIYNRPEVEISETSSRNYARITDDRFDLIIPSLSDSFHPISAGAYSLNENYLYTVESFEDLTRILKEDGILAVTRWVQFPPSENLKILSTMIESLTKQGLNDIPSKVFAFRSWSTLTIMYKPSGFSASDLEEFKQKLENLSYDIVYYKGMKAEEANRYSMLEEPYFHNYFKLIIESDREQIQELYKSYYFDIKPVIDDRPYFFNFFRIGQVPDIIKNFGKSTQPFGGGGYLILITALLVSMVLSVLFILLPLKLKKIRLSIKRDYKYLIYFFCLGFGFFFIEVPFIQKFILLLGKPAFALATVLFSIMLAAGMGSYVTSRFRVDIRWAVGIIVVYILVFIFGFPFIDRYIISKVLWQRFTYSIIFIIPLGFMMGMPFPLAINKVKQSRQEIIPWLWAINGCTSVMGSIAAVIISIHLGFSVVIGIAAAIYIAAMLVYRYF
jgi:spermidine synthase